MRYTIGSVLLIAIVGCTSTAGRPVQQQIGPAAQEGFATTDSGVRLYYRVVGSGSDTLVIIHGGPGLTIDYFLEDLTPLGANQTLIFYDQRGTGRSSLVSDSVGLSAARFVEDLETIRQHFRIARLRVLAHSWGAAVAALYAIRHPQHLERMILVGAVPLRRTELVRTFDELRASRDSTMLREMDSWRERRLASPGDAAACRAYYVLWFKPFFGVPEAATRTKGDFCAGSPEARANKMQSVDRFTVASLGDWDWRNGLADVNTKTLVIHGTADVIPLEAATEWAEALPHARLVVMNGVGHFPYVEAPVEFFKIVDEFLRE